MCGLAVSMRVVEIQVSGKDPEQDRNFAKKHLADHSDRVRLAALRQGQVSANCSNNIVAGMITTLAGLVS